jgi:glycosyltransferase involved in cell wall biosynthesis
LSIRDKQTAIGTIWALIRSLLASAAADQPLRRTGEAEASGVPVGTSVRGGIDVAVREEITGFSFPERDVDALADRVACRLGLGRSITLKNAHGALERLYGTLMTTHCFGSHLPVV